MHTLNMKRKYAYILYIVILELVVKNYRKVDILSVEIGMNCWNICNWFYYEKSYLNSHQTILWFYV